MSEAYETSRGLDREINAARTPEEMRRLIARRRLVRAELDFEQVIRQHEGPALAPCRRFALAAR